MNGLREEAAAVFKEQKFENPSGPSATYKAIEISANATGDGNYLRLRLGPRTLREYVADHVFQYNPSRDRVESRLKVIKFDLRRDHTLLTERPLFLHVFQAFNLEQYMLFMITRDVMGYHCLDSESQHGGGDPAIHKFWLSNISYMILWSYNARTLTTNAIVIARGTGGKTAVRELQEIMKQHQNLICNPFFLPFVVAMQLMTYSHAFVAGQLQEIRSVEKKTGCNPWGAEILKVDMSGPEPFKHLSSLSETMSSALVGLEDLLRHLGLARSLVRYLDGPKVEKFWAGMPDSFKERDPVRSSCEGMTEAIRLLDPQISSGILTIEFLQRRARNQIQVIFNLITRGDALAGINLARSSKDDSFSMKVIATMTMAFLPATFYAALFSLPTLQWNSNPVMQSNFWIYWAFTLPTTGMIFGFWIITTKQSFRFNSPGRVSTPRESEDVRLDEMKMDA